MDKKGAYRAALAELGERTAQESDLVANLANASAILMEHMEKINWIGFYFAREGGLVLGPFQGRAACVRLTPGHGVCGTALREDRTLIVPDVRAFPGHVACDDRSRSEIVVPLHVRGHVAAVLDADSPELSRFDEEDAEGLGRIAALLERSCKW